MFMLFLGNLRLSFLALCSYSYCPPSLICGGPELTGLAGGHLKAGRPLPTTGGGCVGSRQLMGPGAGRLVVGKPARQLGLVGVGLGRMVCMRIQHGLQGSHCVTLARCVVVKNVAVGGSRPPLANRRHTCGDRRIPSRCLPELNKLTNMQCGCRRSGVLGERGWEYGMV